MTTSKAKSADSEAKIRQFEEQALPLMPQILGMAKRYTRNEQDAQDLVQETFAKAFVAWGQFEQGTNLKAWLFKILYNTHTNLYHKKAKEKGKGSLDDLEEWQIGEASSLTTTASRSAEAEAIDNMPAQVIQDALDRLPAEFKEVVLQAVVVGLPYAEIAQNMGTPVGTVMSRLHRGKKLLRQQLAGYAQEEGYGLNDNLDNVIGERS
ncbi:MAG: sigma-70 family RNA polymerase sigma factor [Micrococcales bacterium]